MGQVDYLAMALKKSHIAIAVAVVVIVSLAGTYLLFFRGEGSEGKNGDDGNDDGLKNRAPIAHAGLSQVVSPGETVLLNGTLSSDPDGDELEFRWDLDDSVDTDRDGRSDNDMDATGITIEHLYPSTLETRQYRVTLNVTDGELSDTAITIVTVLVEVDDPIPAVTFSCSYSDPPLPIPGSFAQYILTVEDVTSQQYILNYSFILRGPDEDVLLNGSLNSLLIAPPNSTMRYIDTNPRYLDVSAGDSITVKDVVSVPEGAVLELYYLFHPDPVGAVELTRE